MSEPERKSTEASVTMLVGILAFCAAILGAVIGGFGTYVAAKAQIDGQARQSQADFLRGQREQAYLSYSQKVGSCNALLGNYSGTIRAGISEQVTRMSLIPATASDCMQAVDEAGAAVELVGSGGVIVDTSSIRNALDTYWYDLTYAAAKYNSKGEAAESLTEFDSISRRDVSSIAAAQRKFFNDATHDIQK